MDYELDQAIKPLVEILNKMPGVMTYASCDGHGTKFPYADFTIDGDAMSLNSLGLIQEIAKQYDWLVFIRSMGPHECTSYFFTIMPIAGIKDAHWIPSQISFTSSSIDLITNETEKVIPMSKRLQDISKTSKAELLKLNNKRAR